MSRITAGSPILGVDPGGHWTGLCLRRGVEVLDHTVVERDLDETALWKRGIAVGPDYLAKVAAAVDSMLTAGALIAVEAVVAPSPHVRRHDGNSVTDPAGALGAAAVFGAVLGLAAGQRYDVPVDLVVVPPQQHGSKPLMSYPPQLISPAEARNGLRHVGTGILRHARSAYDIAGAAPTYAAAAAWRRHA